VLQHDAAVDEVEAGVGEDAEVGTLVVHKPAVVVAVVPGGGGEHGRRDVDAGHPVEVGGEGLGKSSHATAEVEGVPPGDRRPELAQEPHDLVDLPPAGGEELPRIPPPATPLGAGQHRPHRVVLAEGVP
jgi:hypothetical protein